MNGPMNSYDILARFYDLDQGYISSQEIAFFAFLGESYGYQVLELGCGTGRLTVPLAQEGFEVLAVDNSFEMIRIAQQKAREVLGSKSARESIRWANMDVLSLGIAQEFDIVIAANSLLLELEHGHAQGAGLTQACSVLGSRGCAVIEILNPRTAKLDHLDGWTRTVGTYKLGKDMVRVDATTSVDFESYRISVHLTYTVFRPNVVGCIVHSAQVVQHYLDVKELYPLLAQHGLCVDKAYGNYDMSTFDPDLSPKILFIARRIGD